MLKALSCAALTFYECSRADPAGGKRKFPDPFPSRSEDGIAERRGDDRWSSAVNQVHIRLAWSFVDASDWIIVEIRLIDDSVGCRDPTKASNTRSKHSSAFELRPYIGRVDHGARIHRCIHPWDPDLAFVADFNLHH